MGTESIPRNVDQLLTAFRDGLIEALARNVTALYIGGSLLSDDFEPASSDIDFLAIIAEPLHPAAFERLAALHRHLCALSPWGARLEGEYAVQADLRPWGIDGRGAAIEPGQPLRMTRLADVTAENLLALRECGFALYGPAPDAIIPPVDRSVFEAALREYLTELLQRRDRVSPLSTAKLADWLLNSARCIYGLRVVRPCTKREAAEWLAGEMPYLAPALSIALTVRAGGSPLEAATPLLDALDRLAAAVGMGVLSGENSTTSSLDRTVTARFFPIT